MSVPSDTTEAIESAEAVGSGEQSVQAKLDEIHAAGEMAEEIVDVEETIADEADVTVDSTAVDEDLDDSAGTDDEPATTDDDPDEAVASDDASTLPAGYRRAALARGWTSEEIDFFTETKPDEAVEMFKGVYDEYRAENAQWSERGRQLRETDAAPVTEDDDGQKTATEASDAAEGLIPKLDADALIEKHGSEDLIADLLGPVNKMIDRVNAVSKQQADAQVVATDAANESLSNEIHGFFNMDEMKAYKDVYGADVASATQEQFDARMKLIAEADYIATGAVAHGQRMTTHDAMARGLAIVSAGTKDAAIRSDIKASMEKRTKTLSKSNQKTVTDEVEGPITDEELVSRTEARLRNMQGR